MANPPEKTAAADPIDYIKEYIDASAESADRVRFVLLVMVTASILAFAATWNSRSSGWPSSRLIVAANAEKFYEDRDLITGDDEQVKGKVWPKFWTKEKSDRKKPEERDAYWSDSQQAYKSAKEFLDASRFADLQHLHDHVAFLERARIEKVLYNTVPFFGVVFDINDLGIFAGITFIISLLLFRFSLLRELRNLRLAFLQAKTPEHLRLCYDMLAMQQVLTTPPEINPVPSERRLGGRWREAFWNTMSKGLYLIPFAVHLEILRRDYKTYLAVEPIFPGTVRGLWVTATLLVLNAFLTGLCLYLGLKVDRRWRRHARWILENTPSPNAGMDGGTRRNDVPDDSSGEQAEGGTRGITVGSQRAYTVALMFASLFAVFTATLLARVGGLLRSTSDVPTWVLVTGQIVSALLGISGALLGWIKERREAQEQKLRIARLEKELAANDQPALPAAPQDKRE
jgi:hypothetical protein